MARRRSSLVVETANREQRVQQRSRAGSLRDNLVERRTFDKYLKAVSAFVAWIEQMGMLQAPDYDSLDLQLCSFLEYLWECGESKGLAGDSLSGVQHFLMVRRRFSGAWRLLSAWGRLEIPGRAPPMLPSMALGLAGLALCDGRLDYSAIVLFGFHGMLRIGEAFAITRSHVALGSDYCGTISLGMTKGAKRKGTPEHVTCTDALAGRALVKALQFSQYGDALLSGTPYSFRAWFSSALERTGLQRFGLKPYSLRRGGATHTYRQTCNMPFVVERGRWADTRTARLYVTEGLALINELQLPVETVARLRELATLLLV